MQATPLVSIIVPCYNHGKFIEAALASAAALTYPNTEVIIIDDGSTDPFTIEMLKKLESSYTVIRQANQGPSVARNNAVKHSKGEFVLALDSDNKVRPEYLSIAIPLFLKNPKLGVVYSDFQYFGDSNEVKRLFDFDISRMLVYNYIDMCSVMRRTAFDELGGFDEYMSKRGLEDWDFWIGMYEKGWELLHLNQVMFDYYVTDASRTVQVANKNVDDLRRYVYAKHAGLLVKEYQELYYRHKQLAETPDYRIGNKLMAPYRALKKLFKG